MTKDPSSAESPAEGASTDPASEPVTLRYQGPSELRSTSDGGSEVALVGNALRDPVKLRGKVKEPLRLREALSVMHAVVGSDFRYVPKDRTAWLAFQRGRQAASGASHWQAQQAYFEWLRKNDPTAWIMLDPIVSVQPDVVTFEVFSKDESTYACLSVDHEAFELDGEPVCGTTNIDFSQDFFDGIQRMRSYRDTTLSIGPDAVAVDPGAGGAVLEKKIAVPDSWLRAFLQVQSAASLPMTEVELAPIELYNVLRHLRFHADIKGKGRGLRVELSPGEAPRLVLEPREEVVETTGSVFQGSRAMVVRLWGRRRLMLLRRLLPFTDKVTLAMTGSGLPSFTTLHCGPMTLTIGLSGWTTHDWSSAACFDLLLPSVKEGSKAADKVVKTLAKSRKATLEELEKPTKLKGAELTAAVQCACRQGRIMIDVSGGSAAAILRLRELSAEPLPLDRLEYRNDRERRAHDLLKAKKVKIESETPLPGGELELVGKVHIPEDGRDERAEMVIAADGRVRRAKCSSKHHRTHGLKQGPSVPLIALRLQHAMNEAKRKEAAESGELRQTATRETRLYTRRRGPKEELVQLSLERTRLRLKKGTRGAELRPQQWVFNSVEAARADFFARVDALESAGWLDASEGGVA